MANIPRKLFIEHFWHGPTTEDASSKLLLVLKKNANRNITIFNVF